MMTPAELSLLANNVHFQFEALESDRDLLKSALRYTHELAALERRDKEAGLDIETPWIEEVDLEQSGDLSDLDRAQNIKDRIKSFAETHQGIHVLMEAAQGKIVDGRLQPWMTAGSKSDQRKKLELRSVARDIERAFISTIADMALFISQGWSDIPLDDEEEGADEMLKSSNGLYLDQHFHELCHRIEQLRQLHSQYDAYAPFGDSWEDSHERYDLWLRRKVLTQIENAQSRKWVTAAMKKAESDIRIKSRRMDAIILDEQANADVSEIR